MVNILDKVQPFENGFQEGKEEDVKEVKVNLQIENKIIQNDEKIYKDLIYLWEEGKVVEGVLEDYKVLIT